MDHPELAEWVNKTLRRLKGRLVVVLKDGAGNRFSWSGKLTDDVGTQTDAVAETPRAAEGDDCRDDCARILQHARMGMTAQQIQSALQFMGIEWSLSTLGRVLPKMVADGLITSSKTSGYRWVGAGEP